MSIQPQYCKCFWNYTGFEISEGYLNIVNINTNKVTMRVLLTDVQPELLAICLRYSAYDVNRTIEVIKLVKEHNHA